MNRLKFFVITVVLLHFVVLVGSESDKSNGVHHCGVEHPTNEELEQDQIEMNLFLESLQSRKRKAKECIGCISIPTYFHIISHKNGTGAINDENVKKQIDVLNDAYKQTPFAFKLKNITRTKNNNWFEKADKKGNLGLKLTKEMTSSLKQGTSTALNIYSTSSPSSIGYSVYPWHYRFNRNQEDDRVVIRYKAITGGESESFGLGYTLVHEVGHWLGLYHVFEQETCNSNVQNGFYGDFVEDTPVQSTPSYDCTDTQQEEKDSCPQQEGKDSIYNFMDYGQDSCIGGVDRTNGFTAGQIERMYAQWWIYRQRNELCSSEQSDREDMFLFSLELFLDKYPNETYWELYDVDGNEIVYQQDWYDYNSDAQTRIKIDLCIPKNNLYNFTIYDIGEDGICCSHGNGYYTIKADERIIHHGGKFDWYETTLFDDEVVITDYSSSPSSRSSSEIQVETTKAPITMKSTTSPTTAQITTQPQTNLPTSFPTSKPTIVKHTTMPSGTNVLLPPPATVEIIESPSVSPHLTMEISPTMHPSATLAMQTPPPTPSLTSITPKPSSKSIAPSEGPIDTPPATSAAPASSASRELNLQQRAVVPLAIGLLCMLIVCELTFS